MNQLLGVLVDICALDYLNNTVVFSCTKEEHWKHLCMVFDRLSKFKDHVKCTKCKLFSKKIEFLGHTASAAGIGVV